MIHGRILYCVTNMPNIPNAPLIEAIFELRWGKLSNNSFQYSNEETLFAGKVSSSAASLGYEYLEHLTQPNQPPISLPHNVTHRFRRDKDHWPCFQVGLGIFTANQIDRGYEWEEFLRAIKTGLDIVTNADKNHLSNVRDTLQFVLRYQDGFETDGNKNTIGYLKDHFNMTIELPPTFLQESRIEVANSQINSRVILGTTEPVGNIEIGVINATIRNRPGILMETTVVSRATETVDSLTIESIAQWADQAHELQRHSFKELIDKSAYA